MAILLHKIKEYFWLEENSKTIKIQLPCHDQGHFPLNQLGQDPLQPGLKYFQRWGIHTFSGQPVPVCHLY